MKPTFWILPVFLAFFSTTLAEEQSISTWQAVAGGDGFEILGNTLPTTDGGFIVIGSSSSFNSDPGHTDAWVVKFDPVGNVEWQRRFGNRGSSGFASSALQTRDGGYLLTGQLNFHLWVAKLDSLGNVQWEKTYGSGTEFGSSILQTGDSGFIVLGTTATFTRRYDAWIIKLNRTGNIQWEKTFGTGDDDYGKSIDAANGGSFILLCNFGSRLGIMKLDESGNILWRRTLLDDKHDGFGTGTSDGGLLITGVDYSQTFDPNVWILKMDSHGRVQWEKSYGSDSKDEESFSNGVETKDGGFLVTGHLNWNLANFFLLKLNRLGEIEWQKDYKTDHSNIPRSLQFAQDGGIVVSGERHLFRIQPPDFWLFKTTPSGNISQSCSVQVTHRLFKLRNNPATFVKFRIEVAKHHDPVVVDPNTPGRRTKADSRRFCVAQFAN